MKQASFALTLFTQAYIDCALWSSTDESGEPLDAEYNSCDIESATLKRMQEDCEAFRSDNAELLTGIDSEQAGHDFWLTRNRHGAGFWDRGLGEIGTKLTEAAHAWGSFDLYVTDNNEIAGS